MGNPSLRPYKLSKYLQVLKVGEDAFVLANGIFGVRHLIDTNLVESLNVFHSGPLTEVDFQKSAGLEEEDAKNAFFFLSANYFIIPADQDEIELVKLTVNVEENQSADKTHVWNRFYGRSHKETMSTLKSLAPFSTIEKKQIEIVLVGGCLAQFMDGPLQALGRPFGLEINVTPIWPENIDNLTGSPDVILFQPGIVSLLGPSWDHFPFLRNEQRVRRFEDLKSALILKVQHLLSNFPNSLILVQGLSSPPLQALGRADFREAMGFADGVSDVNNTVKKLIAPNTNAIFVDEERIFSNFGKLTILDDSVVPFGHHGSLSSLSEQSVFPGPSIKESFSLIYDGSYLLAKEVIDCYILWSGRGKIKLVIVDLDQTLWPGVLGEGAADSIKNGFREIYEQGPYGGLHQALKILKSRGVLLATCSKNDEKTVMEFWNEMATEAKSNGLDHIFLMPEDFVIHRINWNPKSKNVLEISKLLEVDLAAVLFIDDNPVERDEVCFSCEKVRVLGEDLNKTRVALMEDPCLQVNIMTQESGTRTEMMKSQLQREADRVTFTDETQFLRTLAVKIKVKRCQTDPEFNRASELIQRSTQFNTSQKKYDVNSLKAVSHLGGDVFVMDVEDKYTKYGLVGVCVLKDGEIDSFVMSCRVIGIRVAVPFLVTCLRSYNKVIQKWTASITPTERNLPCRDLFSLAGFQKEKENRFFVLSLDRLKSIDKTIYDIIQEGGKISNLVEIS